MKTILFLLITFFISPKEDGHAFPRLPDPGFAVIELFSSEGCSSCPPADALMARIQNENRDKPVYILCYQVDYWDRLGWKDPFSDPAFSERQREYAGWLHLSSLYTPQAVINGKQEFTGSNEPLLRKTLSACLEAKSSTRLSIDLLPSGQVHYLVESNSGHTSLVWAVLRKSASTKVGRGENSGHTLTHIQLVRSLNKVRLKTAQQNGLLNIDPPDKSGEEKELIAFVQNDNTGEITAAGRVDLSIQ